MYAVCELNVRTPLRWSRPAATARRCPCARGRSPTARCTCEPLRWASSSLRGSPRDLAHVARSSSDQTLQNAVQPGQQLGPPRTRRGRSRRRPRAGGARRSRGAAPTPRRSNRAIWQRSSTTGSREANGRSSLPNLPLQASSTRRSSRSPPAADSSTGASTRAPFGLDVQALDASPADPQRRLAVADPQQVDPLAGPLVGHGRLDLEPVRRPQRPERVAQRGIVVVEPFGLVRGMRSTGPATRSTSGSRASAQIRPRIRSPTCAMRSRVYRGGAACSRNPKARARSGRL